MSGTKIGVICEVTITEIKASIFILSWRHELDYHYSDVIMGESASQITSLTIVYSTVYSGADQRK